jgi:hypothetical protein
VRTYIDMPVPEAFHVEREVESQDIAHNLRLVRCGDLITFNNLGEVDEYVPTLAGLKCTVAGAAQEGIKVPVQPVALNPRRGDWVHPSWSSRKPLPSEVIRPKIDGRMYIGRFINVGALLVSTAIEEAETGDGAERAKILLCSTMAPTGREPRVIDKLFIYERRPHMPGAPAIMWEDVEGGGALRSLPSESARRSYMARQGAVRRRAASSGLPGHGKKRR